MIERGSYIYAVALQRRIKMININEEVCIECMTCVSVCPFSALEDVEGFPQLVSPARCIRCMHCGAVCPTEAISYNDRPAILMDEIPRLGEEFVDDLKSHVLRRRSYRHFNEESVPRAIVEEALDLASWAPSAKNQHPARWIVIESKKIMEKIMTLILDYVNRTGISPEIAREMEKGNNVVMGDATMLILAYARDGAVSPETDTAIAITTAELYLQAKGLGTCWTGYLKRMANAIPEIRENILDIPEDCSFYGGLMVGYPEDENYIHVPERFDRADIKWR